MTTMELAESSRRYNESLKRAVSRCKELARILNQPLFLQWAKSLDGIRIQGSQLANAKGRTKTQVESDILIFNNKLATKHEGVH